MYKKIALGLVTIGVFVLLALSNSNRTSAQGPGGPGQEQRLSVDLVRVVNTAEMTYRDQSPEKWFADWSELTHSTGFAKAVDRFSRSSPGLKDLNLGSTSDVVPGWQFRMVTAGDKKSYIILILNRSDKCSGFVSDDDGVISRVAAMGCGGH